MDKKENSKIKTVSDMKNGSAEGKAQHKEMTLQEQNDLINAYISTMVTEGQNNNDERHEFWETQPVNSLSETIDPSVNQPLKQKPPKNEIPTEPYQLPDGFYWQDVNLNDPKHLDELYYLLTYNYVSDKDMMFRFDYSKSFLLWVMTGPGYRDNWSVGVRCQQTDELVGFISAIPTKIMLRQNLMNTVEINYLCLKTNLRGKRMAPILIKEITRRVNLKGIFQAVHTAGLLFSKPISQTNYLHRNINVKKLVQTKFYSLPNNMSLKMAEKLFALPSEHQLLGFRPLKSKDAPSATKLLISFLSKYKLYPIFNEEKFRHFFLSKHNNVSYSYVVENNGIITDFISFYVLNSSVLSHPVHKTLNVAYLHYYANTVTPLDKLINEAFIAAKNMGFDVFNVLNIMDNMLAYEKLKLGQGDGVLNYYIYNWKCAPLDPTSEVALMVR